MRRMDVNPYQSPQSIQPLSALPDRIATTTGRSWIRTLGLWVCFTNLGLFSVWAAIVGSYVTSGLGVASVLQNNHTLGCCGGLLMLGSLLGLLLVVTGMFADALRRAA